MSIVPPFCAVLNDKKREVLFLPIVVPSCKRNVCSDLIQKKK